MRRLEERCRAQPGIRFDLRNFLLAHSLYRKLPQALGAADQGERIQNISVLRNARCAAVLVEPGSITNDDEARHLLRPDFRQAGAAVIASLAAAP